MQDPFFPQALRPLFSGSSGGNVPVAKQTVEHTVSSFPLFSFCGFDSLGDNFYRDEEAAPGQRISKKQTSGAQCSQLSR